MQERLKQSLWALGTLDPRSSIDIVRLAWTTDGVGFLKAGDCSNSHPPLFQEFEAATQLPRAVTKVCPEPQKYLGHFS